MLTADCYKYRLLCLPHHQYIYGFTKISKGPNAGGFFHPEFRREDQKACMTLARRESKEDRRVKKNRPKMMDDLQKSLAKGKLTTSSSTFESSSSSLISLNKKTGGDIGFHHRSNRLPASLLQSFPGTFGPEPVASAPQPSRQKKALSLFDQTFGDDLELGEFMGGTSVSAATTSLGPISHLETKALPAPPSALGIDFSKMPLPRAPMLQMPTQPKMAAAAAAPSLPESSSLSHHNHHDLFLVEPRTIEDMMEDDDDLAPFSVGSLFGTGNENHDLMTQMV